MKYLLLAAPVHKFGIKSTYWQECTVTSLKSTKSVSSIPKKTKKKTDFASLATKYYCTYIHALQHLLESVKVLALGSYLNSRLQ